MLKLKLQYFGHLMRRADSFEKTLMLEKIEGEEKETTEDEMVDGVTNSKEVSLSKLQKIVKDKEDFCAAAHGVTKSQTQLSK